MKSGCFIQPFVLYFV